MKNKTNFNWNRITPEKFEKLVFFLLDDMGYKSLTWRKGGKGVYATDGGRDLEATYVKVEPDDSITVENWWIEVKYRSGGLSKSTVQQIVNNASGRRDVDVFAIVTNTAISNPTLDWIKEFQNSQGRPRIVVWQQHDIERILRKYPRTAADFFTLSLSIAERLEIIKERFWDALIYPSIDEVEELWVNFSSLNWSASNLLPVIAAEAAMGKLDARKWALIIDEELLTETLFLGLINVTFLVIRSEQLGQRQLPLQIWSGIFTSSCFAPIRLE
ncbi:MAG TPA: hypothetical protein ENI27_00910 [bacterium]|nr:hypothetical protein [bacterium]